MELVSERACPETWTCRLVTTGGRLPDPVALERCVREVGRQFWIRGVELVVDGDLVELDDRPAIRVAGSGDVISLRPLSRKVQWDARSGAEQAVERTDREAFERLAARWRGERCPVRLVGPFTARGGKDRVLEVREFFWRE